MFPQLWVLTFEPSDFKHFKAENISMFFLQNEFLCRFVILSFTKGFHSQHMSCTILRTHSLCVNGVSDILRFFNIWQGHPECLYSMKHDSAFMTSVTFIHILQMSFELAVVQIPLRFTLVPLLLLPYSDSPGLRKSNRPQNEPYIKYPHRLLAWYLTHTELWPKPYNIFRCGKMGPPFKPY